MARHLLCVSILLVILSLGVHGQSAAPPPLLELTGDIRVVMLFDFHKTIHKNGTCDVLNYEAVQVGHAAVWAYDMFKTTNTLRDLGAVSLEVYDTCGSAKRALEILSNTVSGSASRATRRLAGVISFTETEVSREVDKFLSVLGYLHVQMLASGLIHQKHDLVSTVQISSPSEERAMALGQTLKLLDWTYISVVTLDDAESQKEAQAFMAIASDFDICISSSKSVFSVEDLFLGTNSSGGVLAFSSNLSENVSVPVFGGSEEQMVLITGMEDIPKRFVVNEAFHNASSRVFVARQMTNVSKEFRENYSSTGSPGESSLGFLKAVLQCSANPLSPCDDKLNTYFNRSVRYTSVRRGQDGFETVVDIIRKLYRSGCLDFNLRTCGLSLGHANITSPVGLDNNLTVNSQMCKDVTILSLEVLEADGTFNKAGFYRENEISYVMNNSDVIGPALCKKDCEKCPTCHVSAERKLQAAVVPGKVYLGGIFPLSDSRQRLSHSNVLAAEAFIWAVETFHRRSGLSSGISIGAFAMDSGGTNSESGSLVRKLENCDNAAAPDPVSSAVGIHEVLGYTKLLPEVKFISEAGVLLDKPVLAINPSGIRINGQISGEFWPRRLAALLKTIHWTYPTVVWSDDFTDSYYKKSFQKTLREHGICLAADHVVTDRNGNDPFHVVDELVKNSARSSAVILMTELRSTINFLNAFEEDVHNASVLNFVFFPWNVDALLHVPEDIALGSVIVDLKAGSNSDFKKHLKTTRPDELHRNAWLSDLQSEVCKERCSSPEEVSECWGKWLDRSADRMASYLINITDSLLSGLSVAFKEHCRNTLHDCKIHQILQSIIYEIDIPFPLDIVNVQLDINGQVDLKHVGEFTTSGEMILSRNFGSEIVSAKSECTGWCPSCHQCEDAFPSRQKYLYTPGDVIIVGIFPVHHASGKQVECGTLNWKGYLDAEAFHFAIQNAASRYPDILPNVTVGSLIVDSCQSPDRLIQIITNLESCTESYSRPGSSGVLSPNKILGYINYDSAPVFSKTAELMWRYGRALLTPDRLDYPSQYPTSLGTAESDVSIAEAVADLLAKSNWTYISIIVSAENEYIQQLDRLKQLASERDICISGVYRITGDKESLKTTYNSLNSNQATNSIVTLLNLQNSTHFFDLVSAKKLRRIWINAGRQFGWVSNNSVVAAGSIFVERPKVVHKKFESYLTRLGSPQVSDLPWYQDFASSSRPERKLEEKNHIVKIISTVDSFLHGFHDFYKKTCPESEGLCSAMAKLDSANFTKNLLSATKKTSFLSDNGKVVEIEKTDCFLPGGIYDVKNFRRMENGSMDYVKVAIWDGKLRFQPNAKFEFYDIYGFVSRKPISSVCSGRCQCVNPLSSYPMAEGITQAGIYGDIIYYDTSGAFMGSPWAIGVVVAAGLGAAVGLLLICYIISRLCIRSLKVKNVDLGLILLLADIALFLSVLPFVYTPSGIGCGLRYLLTSISYTLCFGLCLTKAMNIYEYTSVGLGGEVSRLNTFVILMFIVGVQIAISAQFWIMYDNGTTLLVETTKSGQTLYACNFDKRTFVIYLSYVMLLLFLCALYSFGLRRDRRNLREPRLLLITSVLCLAVWITWIAVLFVMGREYVEPTICVGTVTCASVILIVMFIPKMRHLSRPKQYSLQQSETKKGAGLKSQNEFVFDGPYSLPGSVRSKEKPYANSIVALSSDFFY